MVNMKKQMNVRHLALFAVLGAMMFAGKMVMAHIPNVEPVSLLVMLLAVCCGWQGLYAVAVYVLLEILVWGVNMWALSYLYVWTLLFVAARLLRKMESAVSWAVLAGAFGLGFGALCAIPYWAVGGWAAAVSWWISGIPWDVVHGIGNFVMVLFLFNPLRKGLTRLCKGIGLGI